MILFLFIIDVGILHINLSYNQHKEFIIFVHLRKYIIFLKTRKCVKDNTRKDFSLYKLRYKY